MRQIAVLSCVFLSAMMATAACEDEVSTTPAEAQSSTATGQGGSVTVTSGAGASGGSTADGGATAGTGGAGGGGGQAGAGGGAPGGPCEKSICDRTDPPNNGCRNCLGNTCAAELTACEADTGGGVGGAGGAGGAAPCATCSTVLGDPTLTACPGASQTLWDALATCACAPVGTCG